MPGGPPIKQFQRLSPPGRRRIVIILFAAATLVLVDLTVRQAKPILDAYHVDDIEKKTRAVTRQGVPDIMLLGSSRARYALVPEEFHRATGLHAFNLGIPGSKVAEWQIFARRLFDPHCPRLVVLGVNASEFRADYTPAQAARHLFDWNDLAETTAHDGPSLDVLGAFTRRKLGPLWATYDRADELRFWGEEQLAAILPKQAQLAREVRERVARPLTPDGYNHPWTKGERLTNIEERLLADPVAVDTASIPSFDPASPTFRRFGEMLDWFHARRIAVIVAYIPNSPRTEHRWAEVEPRMIAAIAASCRDHSAPFIPSDHQSTPRTNRDFLDEIHVGYPLALEISRRVARQAVALNLVPGIAPTVARNASDPETQP